MCHLRPSEVAESKCGGATTQRWLPQSASIYAETNWIASNLAFKQPDFATAPSRAAVRLLAELKADDKLQRSFWATHLKARLKRPCG